MCCYCIDTHLFKLLFAGRYTGYMLGKLSVCKIVKLLIINNDLRRMLGVSDLLIPTTKEVNQKWFTSFFDLLRAYIYI